MKDSAVLSIEGSGSDEVVMAGMMRICLREVVVVAVGDKEGVYALRADFRFSLMSPAVMHHHDAETLYLRSSKHLKRCFSRPER